MTQFTNDAAEKFDKYVKLVARHCTEIKHEKVWLNAEASKMNLEDSENGPSKEEHRYDHSLAKIFLSSFRSGTNSK